MYNLLKGKRGIILGALDEKSIAWKVAERAHEEGATFVSTNAPIALRMGEINKLAEKTGSEVIPADATSMDDLENLRAQRARCARCPATRRCIVGTLLRVVPYQVATAGGIKTKMETCNVIHRKCFR